MNLVKIFNAFLSVFLIISCKSMPYSQDDNSSLYYQEMNNIILQSSEQSNKEKELFNAYISSGKYTQAQINDYQKNIEKRKGI